MRTSQEIVLCPICGTKLIRKGLSDRGEVVYHCRTCHMKRTLGNFQQRGQRWSDIWDMLPVVREMPPAVEARRLVCEQRQGSRYRYCPYHAECVENVRRGGAVLCERMFVVAAGQEEVML